MSILIAIPNEATGAESRVAMVPETIAKIIKKWPNIKVVVQSGAGEKAGYPDADYAAQPNTQVVKSLAKTQADVLFCLAPPAAKESLPLAKDGHLITLTSGAASWPALAKRAANVIALEKLPRTSRAQALDVLSSQANLGGYAAVLGAVAHLPRLMPPLTTAAGSSKPANVLVLGVGVAGLQAIATARRLGAQVWAFDVRPEVAEQIKSLGAKVVEVEGPTAEGKGGYAGALDEAGMKQLQHKLAPFIAKADVIISTAQVPGKPAPVLISAAAVAAMRPGSVVADLAAGGYNAANGIKGGNCPLTVANQATQTEGGITLLGHTNWPATVAGDASRFFSQNMANLLALLLDAQGHITHTDELIQAMHIIHNGKVK